MKQIDKNKLQTYIQAGKSSREVAMSFDCSPATVRKAAKDHGLKFAAKSPWRKYADKN